MKKRRTSQSVAALRKGIARRFSSIGSKTVDGDSFDVTIDGSLIGTNGRDDLKAVEFLWEFEAAERMSPSSLPALKRQFLVDTHVSPHWPDRIVRGDGCCIAAQKIEERRMWHDEQPGCDGKGRLMQDNVFNRLQCSRIMTSYLTGQIEANFLDADADDDIAHQRQTFIEFTMLSVSDATNAVRLARDSWRSFLSARTVTRQQAQRVIAAFEALGIARQQIHRLLPRRLMLPLAAFANAKSLESELTGDLLDWTSDFLALRRDWFDGVAQQPHRLVEAYKDEAAFGAFFEDRFARETGVYRSLQVWTPAVPKLRWTNPHGVLLLVYVEEAAGLDGFTFNRYWLLSQGWSTAHLPCLESMQKAVTVAKSMRILVAGRLIPNQALTKLEDGKLFAPAVAAKAGLLWYPDEIR